jgi:hypothetical protein
MAKSSIFISSYTAQANAMRDMAERDVGGDAESKAKVLQGAQTLENIQRSLDRKAAAKTTAILTIVDNAAGGELGHYRQFQAVARGTSIYLPICQDTARAMPNAFLRSSLFSVAESIEGEGVVLSLPIATLGEMSITLTGLRLIDYDRQVFATALSYYAADRPLADAGDTNCEWVKVTFAQFAAKMGIAYGAQGRAAIHKSLLRLRVAQLRLRINRRDIPMPSLIDVFCERDDFIGPVLKLNDDESKTQDFFTFRVPLCVAELFGPTDWTKVPKEALTKYSGLLRWLTSFYATHSKPFATPVKQLLKLTGSICTLPEFRRRLKVGLTKLQDVSVPDAVRVKSFTLDKAKDTLAVTLCCWKEISVK